jgi:diacylglycerol O-acyltransferase / wax synthase
MSNGQNGERLSWGDALFLYLERSGMPLNIACVCVFEGDITLSACRRFIASKLPLLPRYTQRAFAPPFNVGFPSWEDDPDFDIRRHIGEVMLKQGTDDELKSVAGKIFSAVMDREHPLWDLTLVHGLKGNRMAMIIRVHHCLADGIAGVALVNVLLDSSPKPRYLRKKKLARIPRQRDSLTLLFEGWLSSYSDLLQRALSAQSDLVTISERTLGIGFPTEDFGRFLPELTAPTERLFFNKTYQGPQKFAWAQVPTEDIKTIRRSCGGTHNDVVLALMTATIRRYVELHGDKVKARFLRMMVPVNIRGDNDASELGNRISLLPVTVPLGIRAPGRLLAAVHNRMDFLKRAHVAEWVGLAGGLVGAVPAPLQALVGPLASFLPIAPFNLVCTNIRGPDVPLYLIGHKMLDWYPYVPVGGQMALNCAILSYNGTTYFGFSGDVHAAPDLHRLEHLMKLSIAELLRASGRGRPQHKTKRARAERKVVPRKSSQQEPASSTVVETATSAPVHQSSPAVPEKEAVPLSMAAD